MNLKNGEMYRYLQCTLAYENLSLAGYSLTFKEAAAIFDDPAEDSLVYDHFLGFDYLVYHLDDAPSTKMISNLHFLMTKDRRRSAGADVRNKAKLSQLLSIYEKEAKTLGSLLTAHIAFMTLMPFGKSSGMVGRMLLFKECLRFQVMPFIIRYDEKNIYQCAVAKRDIAALRNLAAYEQTRLRLALKEPDIYFPPKIANVRQSL